MRKVLFMLLVLMVAGMASAQILNSKHDFSVGSPDLADAAAVEVCVFCHTPHQPTTANRQYPLWNHTLSTTVAFQNYASSTMNATINSWGGGALGTANNSQLCMSCHDGSVGIGSLLNQPTPAASLAALTNANSSYIGSDLRDDHPVNFVYDATLVTADGGLVAANNAGVVALLQGGAGGTVQCTSCHDAHETSTTPDFMRATPSLVDSALCVTCHAK